MNKSEQLQIRVSSAEKNLIRQLAKQAKMDMSKYVVSKVLANDNSRFMQILRNLIVSGKKSYALADLNDFLDKLKRNDFLNALNLSNLSDFKLNSYLANYVAAMIELAATKKNVAPPDWLAQIEPLEDPVFGSDLKSLRLHLLLNSPAPFRKRNIFIDASIGDRI